MKIELYRLFALTQKNMGKNYTLTRLYFFRQFPAIAAIIYRGKKGIYITENAEILVSIGDAVFKFLSLKKGL